MFIVDYITVTPVDANEIANPTASGSPDPVASPVPVSVTTLVTSASPVATLSSSTSANGYESVLSTKARVGAIAGGVVGGFALLVLAGLLFNFWRRKARRPRSVFSK